MTSGEFVPLHQPRRSDGLPVVFAFQSGQLLLLDGTAEIATAETLQRAGIALDDALCIGEWEGRTCVALAVPEDVATPGLRRLGLRAAYTELGADVFAIAGRALQVVEWDRGHRYCARCGILTEKKTHEYSRRCPSCELSFYPRIAPAVMVLVHDGHQMLLARGARHAPGQYTAVAGFVEAGETIEQTCAREVREEIGVEIDDLVYFGSQSWPFPHSLMIAFTARYAGGAVQPDGEEIEDAAWFSPDALPRLPMPISIAYRLITATAERLRKAS